jgi:iron transport multicopper oxidase
LVRVSNLQLTVPRSYVNGAPYVFPKVPTLYTVVTTGEHNTNPAVYGGVNPFIVSHGDIVDIVVNNHDFVAHPFHLHGHHFQVLKRPATGTGDWPSYSNNDQYNSVPPRRDTVVVMPKSYAVLRFEANNPGVYLFHCHMEWHLEGGLAATIIEGPEMLRGAKIPQDHIDACKKVGMGYEGNANGAVDNPLDTSGVSWEPPEHFEG